MKPTQDWMLLKPIKQETPLALPEEVYSTISEAQIFEVLDIGPWNDCPMGDGEWRKHGVVKGDVVVTAGMPAKFEHYREKYICARARDVAFIIEKGQCYGGN